MKNKIILLSLIAVVLTSCVSQKRVTKICATCPTETIYRTDTLRTQTIDTVYKTSQLDSLIFISTIDLSKGVDTIYFEDETWKAQLFVTNHKLKAKIEHLSDSIDNIVVIDRTEVNSSEVATRIVLKDKIVPKYNGWYRFLLYWWIGSLVLIILGVVILIFRAKLKLMTFNLK